MGFFSALLPGASGVPCLPCMCIFGMSSATDFAQSPDKRKRCSAGNRAYRLRTLQRRPRHSLGWSFCMDAVRGCSSKVGLTPDALPSAAASTQVIGLRT